jgi:polysaccharide biosynthesis protein PslH
MKILQLHNKVPYPPKDGGSIGVWNFTLEFAMQGHNITLLAMNTKKHHVNIKDIPPEYTGIINIIAVRVDALITISGALINLLFSGKPYNAQRFMSANYKKKLIELLSSNSYDVILLEGLYLSPYISTIRKYSKAEISLKIHNIEHEIWKRIVINETRIFKKIYLKILTRRIKRMETTAINKYDNLIAFTERDANFFNSMGNKKPFFVSPVGINLAKFKLQKENVEFPSVFFIGALDWAPNQEGLMWFIRNVWTKVYEKFNHIVFYVAGRNAPSWLIKLLNTEGIKYVGEICDAYAFMNTKSVMVVPLLSGSGMRIKIIEGMALGKAIITTSIGTEGINTVHNQDIIISDTADQFIHQLEKLITDKSLCETLGTNAVKFVKNNYDISKITTSLASFYERQIKKQEI